MQATERSLPVLLLVLELSLIGWQQPGLPDLNVQGVIVSALRSKAFLSPPVSASPPTLLNLQDYFTNRAYLRRTVPSVGTLT